LVLFIFILSQVSAGKIMKTRFLFLNCITFEAPSAVIIVILDGAKKVEDMQ